MSDNSGKLQWAGPKIWIDDENAAPQTPGGASAGDVSTSNAEADRRAGDEKGTALLATGERLDARERSATSEGACGGARSADAASISRNSERHYPPEPTGRVFREYIQRATVASEADRTFYVQDTQSEKALTVKNSVGDDEPAMIVAASWVERMGGHHDHACALCVPHSTSSDLEKLHEMAMLDYERERAENEHLRSALNRIAMSPFSSEAARGIAAVALQVPRGENAVANPAAPGAASQHSAESRTASGVTGRRDGHNCGCIETYPQLVPGKVSHGPGCAASATGDRFKKVGTVNCLAGCTSTIYDQGAVPNGKHSVYIAPADSSGDRNG